MKNYTAPAMEIARFEAEHIAATTSEVDLPDTGFGDL